MNSPTGPSSLNEADELALDAFLSELHRPSKRPPDLSSQILQALAELPLSPSTNASLANAVSAANEQVASTRDVAVRVIPRSAKESGELLVVKRPHQWRRAVAALSLAASVIGIAAFSTLYWQSDREIAKQKAAPVWSAKQDSRPSEQAVAQTKPDAAKEIVSPSEQQVVPRTAIVLNQPSVDKADPAQDKMVMTAEPGSQTTLPAPRVSVGAVATAMNRHLNEYWKRIGIEPTQTASDSEIASRIENRIGYKPNVVNGSVDEDLFASKEQAEPIAARLVSTLTDRLPLSGDARQQMIGEAAETLAAGAAFDGLIANWIQQGRFASVGQPQAVGEVVAASLLDADLACARCHDSPVDSSLTQKDYWSFAACFKPTGQANLFYELPDGRQRAADAGIPARWTGRQESGSSAVNTLEPSIAGVAHLIKNNSRLAQSLANHVWETVYGAPLVSKSSDPLAPPRDDALQQMHARLATAIQDAVLIYELRIA